MDVLNRILRDVCSSTTLTLTSLAKRLKREGKDVVNFASGEPDFDTPSFIKEKAREALDRGFTKYTPSSGIPELKEAIVKKLKEENNLFYHPDQILITTGAKFAVFVAVLGLINPGDEVILFSPYWVSYPEMIKIARGKIKVFHTQENGFKIDPDRLRDFITDSTKVIILNYPANPTGVTYTKEELEAIWKVIRGKGIYVISDEIYEKILFDGIKHVSFASLDEEALARTITINGFSKSFSMTGWRIGYLAGPKELIKEFKKIIDHTTSCPNSIAQYACLSAFSEEGKRWQEEVRQEFERRRELLYSKLKEIDKLTPLKPQGTFYLFCDIRETGISCMGFSSRLLEKYYVATIPSLGFGIEGFLRLSFSTDKESILKGVERIKSFISEL